MAAELTKHDDGSGSAHLTGKDGKDMVRMSLYDFLMMVKEAMGNEPGEDAVVDSTITIDGAKFNLSIAYVSDTKAKVAK